MNWAQRLKRVFGIEIESCEQSGGKVRVIASIEDPALIGKILKHLESRVSPLASRIFRKQGGGSGASGRIHDAGSARLRRRVSAAPEFGASGEIRAARRRPCRRLVRAQAVARGIAGRQTQPRGCLNCLCSTGTLPPGVEIAERHVAYDTRSHIG